jgi:hypothetical protein
VLLACRVAGCGYGVNGHGLCGRHLDRWRRAKRPELTGWLAGLPTEVVQDRPAVLRGPRLRALDAAKLAVVPLAWPQLDLPRPPPHRRGPLAF